MRLFITNTSSTTIKIPEWSSVGETRISINGGKPIVIVGDGPKVAVSKYRTLQPGESIEWTEELNRYVGSGRLVDASGQWRVERSETFARPADADAWHGTLYGAAEFHVRK